MALADLAELDQFKTGGFPADYPRDQRTFFAPVDDVHGVLMHLLNSVTRSLYGAMYGFDDEEIADKVLELLSTEHIPVLLALDSSQAGGVHERKILAREHYPAASVVTGRSRKGAIMHDKLLVLDGHITIGGSTNESDSGERLQENQLVVQSHPLVAAEATANILAIHNHMLQAARRPAA